MGLLDVKLTYQLEDHSLSGVNDCIVIYLQLPLCLVTAASYHKLKTYHALLRGTHNGNYISVSDKINLLHLVHNSGLNLKLSSLVS
jgi:hypothetical protein